MKKNLLAKVASYTTMALSIAALSVSCDVSTDNIGVGTDETVTEIPLATIKVDLASFIEDKSVASRADEVTYSYQEIFGAIDAITPLMPSGEEIELAKLGEETYVTALVETLIEELADNEDNCVDLCKTVVTGSFPNILTEINNLLDAKSEVLSDKNIVLTTDSSDDDIEAAGESLYKTLNIEDGDDLAETRDELIADIQASIVTEILAAEIDQYTKIEDTNEIPAITIDQSKLDLFTSNLGEDNNKLYLRVSYTYDLPITMSIETEIEYTLDGSTETDRLIEIGSDDDTDDNGEISEDELDAILAGFSFKTAIEFGTLTTSEGSLLDALKGKQLTINLSAKKKGAIVF